MDVTDVILGQLTCGDHEAPVSSYSVLSRAAKGGEGVFNFLFFLKHRVHCFADVMLCTGYTLARHITLCSWKWEQGHKASWTISKVDF